MTAETAAQERVIRELSYGYDRTEVRPMADESREVWGYNMEGVLIAIHTVSRGGNYGTRPGWRIAAEAAR